MSDDLKHGTIDGLEQLLLNRRQTARAMAISVRLLDQITKEQRLPFVRLNRRVLFDPQDVRLWIESHKQNMPFPVETNKEACATGAATNVPTGRQFGVTEDDSGT